jgi:hypothetical protein
MSALLKQTTIQYPMAMVFEFNGTDTMVNTSGNSVAIGVTTSGSNTVFDIGYPPPGAVVVGGRVIVLTAFDSTANTLDVGDSDDPDRYTETGAIDLQDADAPVTGFDMLGDGKSYSGSQAIRLTFSNTVTDATAGRAIVVVQFVVPGRANENLRTVAP